MIITTVAGSGEKGFAGDRGYAVEARLDDPTGIARGPDGFLYVCDTANHRLRKVSRVGRILTAAGSGERGYSGDGGPADKAALNEPYEVRFDLAENVFWVERLSHSVRMLDVKTGKIRTIAGTGQPGFSGDGGPAAKAQLNDPHSIGFDRHNHLYICDVKNHRIRKVDMSTGVISTLAGTGERQPTPDGGRLTEVPLHGPRAMDFDAGGNLWLALREGHAIYKLDLEKGTVHHVAGTGERGYSGDGGPAAVATFAGPKGLSVAPNGDVYIADTENHVIRRIDAATNTIETVVGTGDRGDGPEGGDPRACKLNRPHGIFVDRDGTLFIGDSENHRVRMVRAKEE